MVVHADLNAKKLFHPNSAIAIATEFESSPEIFDFWLFIQWKNKLISSQLALYFMIKRFLYYVSFKCCFHEFYCFLLLSIRERSLRSIGFSLISQFYFPFSISILFLLFLSHAWLYRPMFIIQMTVDLMIFK